MKLEWMEEFADPYLKTPIGKGVFLSGVVLGMIALNQVSGNKNEIDSAPLFKQIMFGKMQIRDLKRHLSRVPELLKAYDIRYKSMYQDLTGKAGELLMSGNGEMGVDGNFAFSVAFLNADTYYFKIFRRSDNSTTDIEERGS